MGTNRITADSPVRPMRAVKIRDKDKDAVRYPCWVSPKIDGWRAIVKGGTVLSNAMLPIANRYVQMMLGRPEFEGFDGELFVRDGFNLVTSAFNSEEGEPDFEFHVFDIWNLKHTIFEDRYNQLLLRVMNLDWPKSKHIHLLEQRLCYTWEEIQECEEEFLNAGHEGICGRYWIAEYKFGRGTLVDQTLWKRKPFEDGEAQIIGFEEQLENTNELIQSGTGLSKRTNHQAGKVAKGTLGKIICTSREFGEIKIGTGRGLDRSLRDYIWNNKELFLNKFVTYKFQRTGTLNKPRIAVLDKETCFEFHRMREIADMALEN